METRKTADYYAHARTDFLDWVGGQYERVLEVGCGTGSNASWYRGHGARQIVGVELDASSSGQATALFDSVICGSIEDVVDELEGPFDLIVCADVLEHLVDPWTVIKRIGRLAVPTTVLAISVPNIRFVGAIGRIAVGSGFAYEAEGIFDSTHLRFFTRNDLDRLVGQSGFVVERWGSAMYGRYRSIRSLAQRVTGGWSDQWLAEQLFVLARPSPRSLVEPGSR